MATPVLGKIDEFDRHKEEWPQYVERLGFFFIANSITTAEKKRAIFLSVVGAATYKVLRNLISPELPSEKSYDELVSVLEQHYNPAPSEIVERFRFYCRTRKPGESVANFLAQLRSLATRCNYGDSLENMLRDRLVCGINDDSIQKRLLAERNLTYKRAVELARGLETADRNVKLLKSGATSHIKRETPLQDSPQVNRVASNKGSTAVICYRCGIAGHTVEQCRYSKDIVCHGCRKAGHLQRACKGTNPSQNRVGARKKDSRPRRPVRHIEEEGAGEEDVEEPTLLKPHTADRVEQKQSQQKAHHDARAKSRIFKLGDAVFVKNYGSGRRWLPGKIEQVTGPVSFQVKLDDGRTRRCHQDQIRIRVIAPDMPPESDDGSLENTSDIVIPLSSFEGEPQASEVESLTLGSDSPPSDPPGPSGIPPESSEPDVMPPTAKSYPSRSRVPPDRYEPSF